MENRLPALINLRQKHRSRICASLVRDDEGEGGFRDNLVHCHRNLGSFNKFLYTDDPNWLGRPEYQIEMERTIFGRSR